MTPGDRLNHWNLIEPYGGSLVNLLRSGVERAEVASRTPGFPRIQLTVRQICDLELLATGAFSPLDRFLGKRDYDRVLEDCRLANGVLFPIPVTLTVDPFPGLKLDSEVGLCDQRNNLLAILRVEEVYEWDPQYEALSVCDTNDVRHPLVAEMLAWGKLKLSGPLRVFMLPKYYDFQDLRLNPAEVREKLVLLGRPDVVAFQTRNPLHRAHEELSKRAAMQKDATLLLHPVIGMTKPGDIDQHTRVRSYRVLVERYYDSDRTQLSLLPLAMRMAGPREAVWHAIIRRNFGANYFIVGRGHANPGLDSNGRPFYDPYAAQELLSRYSDEVGVGMVPFSELVYLPDENRYEEKEKAPSGARTVAISGNEVRESYLLRGEPLPAWFIRPEVASILAQSHPPLDRQGFCVWFTGLSGSGKSTTAEILTILLLELGRQVTLLDGDIVRTHLSAGLGFSKEDRDINIRRIGFVASEIARHGGAVICAAVSPYRASRNECRAMFGDRQFIEVFVDTPLEVCEQRDPKGMYARARKGEIKSFTSINDPYEAPYSPEILLDTILFSAEANAERILTYLNDRGFIVNWSSRLSGKGGSGIHTCR